MDGRLDRRAFLARSAMAGGGLVLGGTPVAMAARSRKPSIPLAGNGVFAQGIASGGPSTRTAAVWTRLGGYSTDRLLTLEVATDEKFRRVIHSRRVIARAGSDHCVKANVRGLKPGERYYYRFHTRHVSSPVGRFQTLRPADSLEPVRIAFFSCQDWASGYFGAHSAIAADDDLDLVICLGDYIYERNYYKGPREDKLGKNKDGEVETLAEYREKYRYYKTDADLRRMHSKHAMIGTWDDHEVEDNYAGTLPGDETMDKRVPFLERRAAGYRAYADYMPFQLLGPAGQTTYRRIALGRHAEFFLLDQRQYRDDQPCGDSLTQPCPASEQDKPGRAFLGRSQMQWLKDGLAASKARWKLIGNPLMIMSLDTAKRMPLVKDSWDGYGAERFELLDHIRDKSVRDVSFLTGDIHTYFAGEVHRDGRTEGNAVATEFVGGSISSRGVIETLQATAKGAPIPPEVILAIVNNVETLNPQLKFHDFKAHGYAVVEATADELKVDFMAVEGFTKHSTTAQALASFTVQSGDSRVQRR